MAPYRGRWRAAEKPFRGKACPRTALWIFPGAEENQLARAAGTWQPRFRRAGNLVFFCGSISAGISYV